MIRQPWLRGALVLALPLCLGCAARSLNVVDIGGQMCPVYLDPSARSVARDTVWHRTSFDQNVCRSPDDRDKWIGQITWFQQDDAPERIIRFARIQHFESLGVVNDSTRFNLVRHEFLITGSDTVEVVRKLSASYKESPPAGLVRLVKGSRRK